MVDAVHAGADAAIPGVPVTDTIKRVRPHERGGAWSARRSTGRSWSRCRRRRRSGPSCCGRAHVADGDATDDAALVEAVGGTVVVVPGEPTNIKITDPADLAGRRRPAGRPSGRLRACPSGSARGSTSTPSPTPRTGRSCSAAWSSTASRACRGHSDADVVAHACADALLGAAGLGDIGEHFPDTDPPWRGADSIELLHEVAVRVRFAGWEPGNVDCSVVCERPRLAPRRDEMQQRLTEAVGAPVTVKGNRAEGLGAIGRAEGVACFAVAVVSAR